MNTSFPKKVKQKLKIVAYYQIAGGVFGLVMLLKLLASVGTITGIILLILLFVAGIYSFSIFCGRQILKGKIDLALQLSMLLQSIQIFSFAIMGYSFKIVAGFGILLGFNFIEGFHFGFKFHLVDFQINLGTDDQEVALYVNLFATYIMYYISELREDIKEYRMMTAELDTSEDSRIWE